MKFLDTVLVSLGAVAVQAQATASPATADFNCTIPDGNFCAGPSLQTNYIIRCSGGIGQPGNCNDNLAGIPPVGVKTFAPCYESSPTAGDAACSFNCIVYGGPNATIPGCISSTTTSSTETSTPTGTGTPIYPTSNNSTGPSVTPVPPPVVSPSGYASVATTRKAGGILVVVGLFMAAIF